MERFLLLIVSLILFSLILFHYLNISTFNNVTKKTENNILYDNSHVALVSPPKEIIINENNLSCHTTPTRCTSNADCQLCLEGLASCQEFNETVILEINDNQKLTVNPGERYCLALDNRRARSCNPNTGTWILRHVDNDNFALICHCDMPGLVTQLNIYDDCTFAVGCKPHGVIADINTTPLVCLCETGFVPEISNTNTPYCRPKVMRNVMLAPNYYLRPRCQSGFLPANHPVFNTVYRQQIGANVCLPDPCSVDPLTGEKHEGYVLYQPTGGADKDRLVMCICDIEKNLYPVYSVNSMIDAQYTKNDSEIANYCIKPLTVQKNEVRSDIKVFWARNSLKSDADMVFQVNHRHVHKPYHVLLYGRLTAHPNVNVETSFLLKFQIHSAYVMASVNNKIKDIFQWYWNFNYLRNAYDHCPIPGKGQCYENIDCNDSVLCYDVWCITNRRVTLKYRNTCYFYRKSRHYEDVGDVKQVCIWNYPTFYYTNDVPVTFFINGLGPSGEGVYTDHDIRRFYFTSTLQTVPESQYNTLIQLLATFPHYNS
nr:pif-1 [Pieris rapae granulovirus]